MSLWNNVSVDENTVGHVPSAFPSFRNNIENDLFNYPAKRNQPVSRLRSEAQKRARIQPSQHVSASNRSDRMQKSGPPRHQDENEFAISNRQPQKIGIQSLSTRTGSPVSRRPPLARLPENRLLSRNDPGINHGHKDQRVQMQKTKRHKHNQQQPSNGNDPRRLLWPTSRRREHVPPVPPVPVQHSKPHPTLICPNQRTERARPLTVRNEFRSIASIKKGCQMNTPPLESIEEGRKLSTAEQRYTPKNQEQLKVLRKGVQTRFHDAFTDKAVQLGTSYLPSPPTRERRPSMIERFVDNLPQSPPTLHVPDSPPNPGSPRKESPVHSFDEPNRDDVLQSTIVPPGIPLTKPPALMRKMLRWEIWLYRIAFGTIIVVLNVSILTLYLLAPRHHYLLAFLVFMKSKDLISTVVGILGTLWIALRDIMRTPPEVDSKWIMSIICAYAETEVQIMKTIDTLVKQELVQHKQVITVILDGKPRNILQHFTRVTHMMDRPYTTWKGMEGNLQIHAGFVNDTPIILIQKAKNAGKKDTLILGHSLFNYPRDDVLMDLRLIRRDLFAHVLPDLTGMEAFKAFDYVYATDADSIIHKTCLKRLADALARNTKAIAACGIILAELDDDTEWSAWHLFQQFQYTFGQFIRRSAETTWGRVTCLPGPVTMIAVRPEMGAAISEYAAPITNSNLFVHQVQYQGTDRRLTWCMLAQGKHLQTILVTNAIGETVVPGTLDHYLSQRRRWASNAYFNDYMYAFGKNQYLITRLFGIIDIVRMSFVYYRVMNTALFIRSLIRVFYVDKIIPTLVMTKSPTAWFLFLMLVKEPLLRKRLHKLLSGLALNQFMSPILSVISFSRVILNMGNHAWGTTGMSSKDTVVISAVSAAPLSPKSPWSPRKLVQIVRSAITHPQPQVFYPASPEKTSSGHEQDRSTTPTTTSSSCAVSEIVEELKSDPNSRTPKTQLLSDASGEPATPVRSSATAETNFIPESLIRKRTRPRAERTPCQIPPAPIFSSMLDETKKS